MRFVARLKGVGDLERDWQRFGHGIEELRRMAVRILEKDYPKIKYPGAYVEISEIVEVAREVVRHQEETVVQKARA